MSKRAENRRADRAGRKPGAVISWISSGMLDHEFMASVIGTALYDHQAGGQRFLDGRGGFLNMVSSPRIVEARTQIISTFLDADAYKDAEWLVTVDADMVWSEPTVHDMLDKAERHDRKVVGGLCIAGGISADQYPTAYRVTEITDDGMPTVERIDLSTEDMRTAAQGEGSMMVDATGAAFMAIHRDVLLHMWQVFHKRGERINPHPWYEELTGPDGQQYGEDITLCLRARQLGYDIWLDFEAKIGHMKRSPLTFDTYLASADRKAAAS